MMPDLKSEAVVEAPGPGAPAEQLLPHRGGMRLLDELMRVGAEGLAARAVVREDGLFVVDGRMGAWVLLEYMAQAMAMWISWNARREGKPVPVGFLLGTRRMELFADGFAPGDELVVEAEPLYVSREDRLAQFSCCVRHKGEVVARARLNAFEPEDPKSMLAELGAPSAAEGRR